MNGLKSFSEHIKHGLRLNRSRLFSLLVGVQRLHGRDKIPHME